MNIAIKFVIGITRAKIIRNANILVFTVNYTLLHFIGTLSCACVTAKLAFFNIQSYNTSLTLILQDAVQAKVNIQLCFHGYIWIHLSKRPETTTVASLNPLIIVTHGLVPKRLNIYSSI